MINSNLFLPDCMQSCRAYYGCPHCEICFLVGPKKPHYGGYRCYLPASSPFRGRSFVFRGQHYMFVNVEKRTAPNRRTDSSVRLCLSMATASKPFRGHKSTPFLYRWLGFNWAGNTCDVMHDIKCACEMTLKIIVGKGSHGWYKSWNKDDAHREECKIYNIFNRGNGDLPWRLSKDDVNTLDARVRAIWWPHYMDKLCSQGFSFWKKPDRCWKSAHKSYIFLVLLPTCLWGFVPAVHTALLVLVYALRRLDGQVVSVAEASRLGIEPGSHSLDKLDIKAAGDDLVRGLVLLEGCLPGSHLNPALHHLVHYSDMVANVGVLRWFSMFSFERNNKKVKGLARNGKDALACVANNIQIDIATRYIDVADSTHDQERPSVYKFAKRPRQYT